MDELLYDDAVEVEEEEPPFIIRGVRHVDGASVIEVEGEVDLSTSPQLKEALAEVTDVGQAVIVDLSRVEYMDSSGFGALLGATRQMRPLGGSMHIIGANPSIERMLLITRLSTMFFLHDSEENALRAVRTSGVAKRPV